MKESIPNNKFSSGFLHELKKLTAGFLTNEVLGKVLEEFSAEFDKTYFTVSDESRLLRIFSSLFDPISFLSDCLKYPHYVRILSAIACNSNYLTDIIVRNPEYLYWITSPENLEHQISDEQFKNSVIDSLSRYKTLNAKVNFLKTVKRREFLRIGVNDILGNLELPEVTRQLSLLATTINNELFGLCYKETLTKYGIKSITPRYVLCALGKLGGNELNYSSDTDFILFFDKNSKTGAPRKEFFEILSETVLLFIENSTKFTDKGYLYRVDFRLRPDGRNSPLCRTIKDFTQYYESRGEDWERQMLIKLSFVSGSLKLYDSFFKYMQHFIYPTSFSSSPLEQIAAMKSNIEKNIGAKEDVKLFSGGIRDIEFSLQALQLLNGGKYKDLRTGNSLDAIQALLNRNILSSDEAALFSSAYIFYRRIEHYIQLMNDIQTHEIPEDTETQEKLARYMGTQNLESFRRKVTYTRKAVRNLFESIVGTRQVDKQDLTDSINFRDRKKSIDNLKYLRTGQGLLEQKQFDKHTIDAFRIIENDIMRLLSQFPFADTAIDNLARIIKTRPLPSIWYHEMKDATFLSSLLRLCEFAQKAVDMIISDISLGDLLLSRKAFLEDFEVSSDYSLKQVIFILIIQFSLNIIDHQWVSSVLHRFLVASLSSIINETIKYKNYVLLGMGSFGAVELTFNSDVDIIIIAGEDEADSELEDNFQKALTILKARLTPLTIDVRLKPEGLSGNLVWDIANYSLYIEKRIQTWELQSLTRMTFICGDLELFKIFKEKILIKIKNLLPGQAKADIAEMRAKIEKQIFSSPQSHYKNFLNLKKSPGALLDIEFLLQYYLLISPVMFETCTGLNNEKIIHSFLNYSDFFHNFTPLIKDYSFLKRLEIWNQVLFNSNNSVLPLDEQKRLMLAKVNGFTELSEFESQLISILQRNRNSFNTALKL